MNQTSLTFLALGGALFLWTSGAFLTDYLSKEPSREYQHPHAVKEGSEGIKEHSLETEVKRLREILQSSPEDEKIRLELANLLFDSGIRLGNSTYLKDSVGYFHEILQKDPRQKDALLGLATLSLHVGASDKAIEYYEKYLEVVPEDISVRSNLALALARSGQASKGIEMLNDLLKADSSNVIAHVTKGLILKEEGRNSEALELFNKAEQLETNPKLLERIRMLRDSSNSTKKEEIGLKDFFNSHPIIGPKIVSITEEDKTLLIHLKDFPVEQMPEFARQKLESSIKLALSKDSYQALILRDAAGKELIKIKKD